MSTETVQNPNKENENNTTTAANGTIVKQTPFDPSVRHPLLHNWTLWYDSQMTNPQAAKQQSQDNWGESIKEVYTVTSVEDFWRLYNNVATPSQLQLGCNYNLFKKGIQPKWEDPSNAQGGKWTLLISKQKGLLDKYWMWLVLACIGEQLDDEQNQICGCVVNVRKGQDKLNIWTKDAENKDAIMKIGYALKKVLELPDVFPVSYQAHFSKSRANKYEI
mmetsp:Transcript_27568/g.38885  ORF Transcript_27568/g.38885 Transcript_27568/m.38885 type:complete len:219 (+) Transcript_27568:192-848(+)|eukprot:CAMPEP_0168561894 /NCGR_PEP_ID=MMETSP0413-20121227/11837_1 /TAXON_ID=136452 /ORGANISM="Filamoeba nolandi, Strain NC-AS-23-1" /LENGTH=218 /DNA_ID=CAMNT_0008593293 /DNA_START=158 /DNA_END=814 /DNA_ORIENTATION=+